MIKPLLAFALTFLTASAVRAAAPETPIVYGQLKAKVGAWAEYSVESKKGDAVKSKGTYRMSVVGKDGDALWIEQKMTVEAVCEVSGGRPWATVEGRPVAATVAHGKGSVTVIGFSYRFTDAQMGVLPDILPDEPMKAVYEFEYALVRTVAEGAPLGQQK